MPSLAMSGPTTSGVVPSATTTSPPSRRTDVGAWSTDARTRPPPRGQRTRRSASGVRTRTLVVAPWRSWSSGPSATQSPTGQDDDPVDGLGGFGQQVRRHEHDPALGRVPAQEAAHPGDALGVEAVGGLVEDQHLGVPEQGPGELEALAHPEREPTHLAVPVAPEADELEHLVHAPGVDPGHGGDDAQVVAGRARRVESRRFEHAPDRPGGVGEVVVARRPFTRRAARCGCHQAEQHPQGRRLPRTVRTEEPGDGAGLHHEAQVVDGEHVAEPLGEPLVRRPRWRRPAGCGAWSRRPP